ncbi:hypothetical protein Bbelb_254170 [Branchiostoma belcheri]|nr:hypothetical protein Bbelb_254170 [Branchiostoma belcheri]
MPRKAQKKTTQQDPKKQAAEDTGAASDDEVNRRCTHLQRASTACTRQRGNRREIVRCKHLQLTYHLRNVRCTQPLTARRVVQTTHSDLREKPHGERLVLLSTVGRSQHLPLTVPVLHGGDFNSKLGAGKAGQEVGRWGKGRQNENGKSLLNFCQQHGLVALNTLFQHHPKHITTWESSFKTDNNRTAIGLDEIRNDKDKQEEWREGKCNTSKRVRELVTARLHAQAAKIEVIKDDNARTFSAMKDLRFSGGDPLAVRPSSGETLVKPLHLANIISKRFESLFKFNIDAAPLPPFQAAPLRKPVTASEVARAALRLKNGRSFGAEGVAKELLKYCSSQSDDPMAITIANIIIGMFSKGEISICHAHSPLIDGATAQGHSTTDIVFTKRISTDLVMTNVWDLNIHPILGIDLSRAFDTVDRDVVDDDDIVRMVHALLTDTTLALRVRGEAAPPFEAVVGSPQGDSLSPQLFNIYYEAALRDLRKTYPPTPAEDKRLKLPPETQYADDLDFISTFHQHLENIHEQAIKILPDWKLQANASKTERIHICWKSEREEETWRNTAPDSPAQKALNIAFSKKLSSRKGRPRTSLLNFVRRAGVAYENNTLEAVQRRAARIIYGNSIQTTPFSTLKDRRETAVKTLFKRMRDVNHH